jgi:nitroimidazol reductase NimA-like FMN-containing flavoprotein (pyridoxamine 5'-phosphate oxidase superfamily)
VANSSADATVTLPPASTNGKTIMVHATSTAHKVTILTQGSDVIVQHDAFTDTETSCTVNGGAEFVSDGTTKWYLARVTSTIAGCEQE